MADALGQTTPAWHVITHLGSAGLLLPTLAIAIIGLWQSGQRKAVCVWGLSLAVAVTIATASKVLFLGWGIGIESLDFTGISGHTLLATSILPMLFALINGKTQTHSMLPGVWLGLLLGAAVGISRVVLGMHSISEIVAGWIIGVAVIGGTLKSLEGDLHPPRLFRFSWLILLLALGSATSNYLPTHDLEIKLAMYLSGHGKPYVRIHGNANQRKSIEQYFRRKPGSGKNDASLYVRQLDGRC